MSNRVKLGDIIKPRKEKVLPAEFPDMPFIGMEHVEAHTMRLLGTVPAVTMKSAANRFYAGDVLYGRLRPYLNKVYKPQCDGLCSAEFIVFPKTEGLHPDFLRYRLNSHDLVSFASHLDTGDRPRVNFDGLSSFEFVLPSTYEDQKQIVAEIEKQFSRLDEAVDSLRRIQANLKRYKAAVLKAAVEGKLTEQWRKEYPDVEPADQLLKRILTERRAKWEAEELAKMKAKEIKPKDDSWKKKYKEPTGPDTANLSELPEGWVWASVEQLSWKVQYGSSSKTSENSQGVPVLRMGNIFEGILRLDELKYLPSEHVEFPELLLVENDLLFNRTNSPELVGKTAVYSGHPSPCSFASYLIRVRFVDSAKSKYASHFINSIYGRNWIASVVSQQVGQANVNGSKLQALTIPLPSFAEQLVILEEIDRRLSVTEELETTIETNLKRAERLRQTILQQSFCV